MTELERGESRIQLLGGHVGPGCVELLPGHDHRIVYGGPSPHHNYVAQLG